MKYIKYILYKVHEVHTLKSTKKQNQTVESHISYRCNTGLKIRKEQY